MKADKRKESMRVQDNPHPGLEQDSKGKPIPMDNQLPEDRRLAKRNAKRKSAAKD
jgi:hypothetical protein